MEWANLYNELKGWQNGLGAVIGFFALMAAALWNFQLNRKRDKQIRAEESNAVLSALYGEILFLRSETANLARIVARRETRGDGEYDEQFVADYRPPDAVVFPAIISKLGLLQPQALLGIIKFYADYGQTRRNLELLLPRKGFHYSPIIVLEHAFAAVIP